MKIERDADDVARCFLLERELFEGAAASASFDGEVMGLIGAGAFVAFGDGHEGLLPVRRLRGDWWELNEEGTILLGERTRRDAAPRRPGARAGRAASTRRAGASTSSRRRRRGRAPRSSYDLGRMAKGGKKRKVGAGRRRDATATASLPLRAARQARVRRSCSQGTEVKALRDGRRAAQGRLRERSATASCGCTTCTSRPTGPRRARTTSPSARASCCCTGARSSGSSAAISERGLTLVPTRIYFNGPAREGRDRARARQGPLRQARDDQGARDQRRDIERALRDAGR